MIEMLAIGAALPIVGRLIDEALSKGDKREAERLYAQAEAQFGPEARAELDAVRFQSLGPSAMAGVQGDGQMDAYAREALRRIAQDASTAGLTAEERLATAEAQTDAAQFARGQREATLQNAAARGISGSGFELASRMSADQDAAGRASRAAMQASASAEARRRMAQGQLLSGATGYQGQLFGQAAQKAQAKDAVDRFNTSMANDAAQWRYGQQQQLRANQAEALTNRADRKMGHATRGTFAGAGVGLGQGVQAVSNYQQNQAYLDWLKKQRGGQ
jgi:hypothetical protein